MKYLRPELKLLAVSALLFIAVAAGVLSQHGWELNRASGALIGITGFALILLSLVAHRLIRSEIGPIADITDQLGTMVEQQRVGPLRLPADGGLGDYARRMHGFLVMAAERSTDLERRMSELEIGSKVLSYQRVRIESVLESLPDAVVILDDAGTTTSANRKLELLLDVRVQDVLGKKLGEWWHNEEVTRFVARFCGPRRSVYRADTLEFSPEGSPDRTIALGVHPLLAAEDGRTVPGTLLLLRDISSEQLAMQAQAEFVGHVAHELKSPLNVLALNSELLLGKDGEREEVRLESCNVIQDEVERLSSMIATLLTVAQIEMGEVALNRQRINLHEFLRDALETCSRNPTASGLKLELDVPGSLGPIRADKDLLRVVVNNLLSNAVKYNQPGGEVVLSAEEMKGALFIRVRDSGLGIQPEDQRRVFEKFFRSDSDDVRTRPGHGLGLALSREIIELHGGRMEVESVPGEGSEFSIVLPESVIRPEGVA